MNCAFDPLFRRYLDSDRAVATIEAAIVLPFVLLLGLGTIEFGWLLSQVGSVQSSLRDAVRYASRNQLVETGNGAYNLPSTVFDRAYSMLNSTFASNGITEKTVLLVLKPSINIDGSLFRGGAVIYTVRGVTRFTPASVGLLSIANVTIPQIQLSYEVRHVGN